MDEALENSVWPFLISSNIIYGPVHVVLEIFSTWVIFLSVREIYFIGGWEKKEY